MTTAAADAIADWVALEMAPWRDHGGNREAVEADLRDFVARETSSCLLRIEDGFVRIDPDCAAARPNLLDRGDFIGLRAATYVEHLNEACSAHGMKASGLIALFLDDILPLPISAPIFSFQKYRGARSLLLPDVDFMNRNYYPDDDPRFADPLSFDAKLDVAIFVGSTTGDVPLTATHVTQLRNNRLRAAVRFRGSDRILFHLPQIVQCDRPETEALVRTLDVGGRSWTWREQLDFRYLLSMDGNGATCSRVVLALKSQSVLFKYNSPYQLFYFRGLQAWRHYVPILADADVEMLLDESEALQPIFRTIVGEANRFARDHLGMPSVLRYSAMLLEAYCRQFGAE